MSAQFFYDRFMRAQVMDATNKVLDKETPFVREALEWLDAYKNTLSNNQKDKFEKEWRKAEEETQAQRNLTDFGKRK